MKKFIYLFILCCLYSCEKEDIIYIETSTNTEVTNNQGGYGNSEKKETPQQLPLQE